jgi:hypothetical protein
MITYTDDDDNNNNNNNATSAIENKCYGAYERIVTNKEGSSTRVETGSKDRQRERERERENRRKYEKITHKNCEKNK